MPGTISLQRSYTRLFTLILHPPLPRRTPHRFPERLLEIIPFPMEAICSKSAEVISRCPFAPQREVGNALTIDFFDNSFLRTWIGATHCCERVHRVKCPQVGDEISCRKRTRLESQHPRDVQFL